MGVASLVLGIISIIMSLIPGIGVIFAITAIIGIILGIVSLCKKQDKGKSIAGIITSAISILITIGYIVIIAGVLGNEGFMKKVINEMEQTNTYYDSKENHSKPVQEFKVGEIFQNEDIKISFLSAEEDFKGYREYADIKEGYKIIKAEFEFENIGTATQYVSAYDFECYADGYKCEDFWSVENSGFSANLSNGKKVKGSVYFEIPTESTSITLEYDLDTWEDEIVSFIVK